MNCRTQPSRGFTLAFLLEIGRLDLYGHLPQFGAAFERATELKRQLEARLIGSPGGPRRCGCLGPACASGPSKVVGVRMPSDHEHNIGMWIMWCCVVEDAAGHRWTQGVSAHIPATELYVLFRQAFAGLAVPLDHPAARLTFQRPEAGGVSQTNFTASGRYVTVADSAASVYVRPKGDLSQSVWTAAELRLDSRMPLTTDEGCLMVCNVDPFAFGQSAGRGNGYYYPMADVYNLPTFDISVPGETLLPATRNIARLSMFASREAVFELDDSVEVFEPELN